MINLNELRTGNWVLKISSKHKDTGSFFEYWPVTTNTYDSKMAILCFPIPLSPDVLGKSGFKHQFGDWYINRETPDIEEGLPFLRYKHADQSWYLKNKKLLVQPLYLHQIQNLVFALSGKELFIQLGQFEKGGPTVPVSFIVKPIIGNFLQRPLL